MYPFRYIIKPDFKTVVKYNIVTNLVTIKYLDKVYLSNVEDST